MWQHPKLSSVGFALLLAQIVSSMLMIGVIGMYIFFSFLNKSDGSFPQTSLLPFNSNRISLGCLTVLSLLDMSFAGWAIWHLHKARHTGLFHFAVFKVISLAAYLAFFDWTTIWSGSEVSLGIMYTVFCAASVWCTAMLSMALHAGGVQAVEAGFDQDLIEENAPLQSAKGPRWLDSVVM